MSDTVIVAQRHPYPTPLLLTVVEAARLLGVGRSTAYELLASGELESVHIGRSRRIPVAAVESYVDGLRVRPFMSHHGRHRSLLAATRRPQLRGLRRTRRPSSIADDDRE